MTDTAAGLLQVGLLVAALAACYRPLGGYLARVFTSERDLRVEKLIYRLVGVDSRADQRWSVYAASLFVFSLVSVLVLYALLRLQAHLPLSLGRAAVDPALAFNTAASFVTNTNWQAYSGESTPGHLAQMAGQRLRPRPSHQPGVRRAADRPHRRRAPPRPGRRTTAGAREHGGAHARVPRRTARQRARAQPRARPNGVHAMMSP